MVSLDGNKLVVATSGLKTVTSKSWTHFAVVNDGKYVRVFQDGFKVVENMATKFLLGSTLDVGLWRSERSVKGQQGFEGYVADFGLYDSVRYTANFTPKMFVTGKPRVEADAAVKTETLDRSLKEADVLKANCEAQMSALKKSLEDERAKSDGYSLEMSTLKKALDDSEVKTKSDGWSKEKAMFAATHNDTMPGAELDANIRTITTAPKYEGVRKAIKEDGDSVLCNSCSTWKPRHCFYTKLRYGCIECCSAKTKARESSWRGVLQILVTTSRKSCNRGSRAARGLVHTITFEDVVKMYREQRGMCYYSGIKLTRDGNWKASLERKNVRIGYTAENCCLVAAEFNSIDHTSNAKYAVLKPWHDELDRSFGKLKKQRDSEHTLALTRLQTIESEMLDLNTSFTELKSQRDAENRAVIGILKELKGSV
ncbi:hypothetical protein JKP88DRAFT_241093 [Tribonema minus]|uniref:Uncharacterized protein n=1 Tax=Tribonema minus TaxID=303371 RepID=A0A835Z7Q5_9STRA|nr:hypothetical protein JKP88DRAFT_241093 [Tribonema minus]